ncbi:unnamed protein product [Leptosia nina]|uniref:Ig-like domain-containing protein n=1 Tax=Leptosia nina TaxID=320188 RepID=A0AAV1JW71_9NEOP
MAAALLLALFVALFAPSGSRQNAVAGRDIGEREPDEDSDAGAVASEAVEAAENVPAWKELWEASLEALRREPALNATPGEEVVQLGGVAFLHCPVRHLAERQVSWVRRRDWHIISSGLFLYTNDERFQVLHAEGSDDWVLQIKYVQKRDNGTYECQVSTGRGALSRLVYLRVVVPEAFILGAEEYHVDAGSTINLVCIIEKSPVPPQYVFWYHNGRMINYDASRGVAVATSPGARTHSALTVRFAKPHHSGNYSCRAPATQPAHISVYVSEGDKMAATLTRSANDAMALGSSTARSSGGVLMLLALPSLLGRVRC